MAENDFGMGYAMGMDAGGGNRSGGDGFWGGDGVWGFLILALLFGGRGFGFGGGGFGGGGGCGCETAVSNGFALNGLENGIRGIQQGLCDGFYAVNTGILTGFNGIQSQMASCCCETQRGIDGVRFDMATGFCNLGNTFQSGIRDVIDNQNANYRGLMDFLVTEKLSAKDARIAALEGQLGRAEQNGVFRAAIDSATAEIIRRTGHDYPSAAFLVQPPTPVNFPTNGCGTVQFGGYGGGGGFPSFPNLPTFPNIPSFPGFPGGGGGGGGGGPIGGGGGGDPGRCARCRGDKGRCGGDAGGSDGILMNNE